MLCKGNTGTYHLGMKFCTCKLFPIFAAVPKYPVVLILMCHFGASATERVTLRRCWPFRHACTTLPVYSWRPAVALVTSLAAHTLGWGQSPPTPPPLPLPPAAHAPAPPMLPPMAHLEGPAAPHPLVRVGLHRAATCRVIVPSYATSRPFSILIFYFHIVFCSLTNGVMTF